MPENEFEKKLREELGQLRVKPSEEVWQQVRAGIRPEKRRRRWLIWVPFVLLGLGVGGYWLWNDTVRTPNSIVRNEIATGDDNNSDNNQNKTKSSDYDSGAGISLKEKKSEYKSDLEKSVTDEDKNEGYDEIKATREGKSPIKLKQTDNAQKGNTLNKADNVKPVRKVNAGNKKRSNESDKLNRTEENKKVNEVKSAISEEKPVADSLRFDTAFAMNTPSANEDKISTDSNALVQTVPDKAAEDNVDSAAASKVKSDSRSLKIPKWEYGIAIRGGVSDIRSNFFLLQSNSTRADSYSGPGPGTQAPGYVSDSLYRNSAFSWGAGFYVQRNLNNRLSVSVAANYHQYNFLIHVGNRVDSQIYVANTLSSTYVDNYYPGGNREYKNRFHYIEIPVAVSLQLNKGKNLPICWHAGVTPGFLINSNFLYPDGSRGIYYQDKSILQKMQWSVQTGFTLGLFNQTGHPLQVGPQIQYMFTNLVKNSAASNQHLGYFGVRATLKLWDSNRMQR